jgi:DNA-binding LytR/AlgR family response regulator
MKCIVIDDEPLAREGMQLHIKEVQFLDSIGEFGNSIAANNFLSTNDVDLMFLDIEMPGMSGLDFLRSLNKRPLVIITTAYPQFALSGFELNVIDYLLKPIRLDHFIKAVNKAKEYYDFQHLATKTTVEAIAHDYIYIKSERKFIKLYFRDILFIKGLKDYVTIYSGKDKIMTAMNIKTIHEQLPVAMFARVSKSHIINIDCIASIDQETIQLKGVPNEEIPLGDTYREDFMTRYVKTNLVQRK